VEGAAGVSSEVGAAGARMTVGVGDQDMDSSAKLSDGTIVVAVLFITVVGSGAEMALVRLTGAPTLGPSPTGCTAPQPPEACCIKGSSNLDSIAGCSELMSCEMLLIVQ